VSTFVFAAQMMNFPIQAGTSGHLIGGVLAAVLLGTPFGVLALALVLAFQCIIFSDGGLAVLGANVLNMAVIGAGVGGWLAGKWNGVSGRALARVGLAAWVSVVLAALACSAELAFGGVIPFFKSAPVMFGVHAIIGLGEAVLTVLAVALIPAVEVGRRRSVAIPAGAALVIAMVLSPFASGFPDGLEWTAAKLEFLKESAPAFVTPLNGYNLAGVSDEFIATSLAGGVGVAAVFFLGLLTARLWARKPLAVRP